MRQAQLVGLGVLLLANACKKDPTPPDTTPASITLSPTGPLTLASGGTTTVTASVATKGGRAVSPTITWSSADPTIATVSGGVITGIKTGTTTVTASAAPATATVQVMVIPGTATQLAIRTQPAGAVIGAPLTTQPAIELRDAAGNVTTSTASVTASIASGGGTLGGTATVAAVSGVATFAGLSISGAAGDRTLTFSSPGLSPVTSASFTITPPPTPVISLDNTSVGLTAKQGSNPAAAQVRVTNTGGAPLTGMSVNVIYDPAGPTGWINASLDSPNAPATLTIAATSNTFDPGTYRATVQVIAPGAANSPANVAVTLSVAAGFTVTYGSPTEKVKVLDIGASFTPSTSVTDAAGQPVTGVALTYVSRSSSVATVAANGTITARAAGDAWVTVTSTGAPDSVFVIVPTSAAAGVVRSTITTWSLPLGDTAYVNVVLDTRGLTVGSGLFAVAVQTQPAAFATILFSTPNASPTPLINNSSTGVLRVSVSSATGMTGTVALVNLKIVGRASGLAGWLTFTALDVSGVDGTDMTRQITSTRLPLVIK
jgi:hypothetical protein